MRVAVGSDHAGFELASLLQEFLTGKGMQVDRYGATSTQSYDYPLAADEVAKAILEESSEFGILVCGSGIGVCIRANRFMGIRAAQCFTVEMAKLARQHNHANVLCLGERIQDYSSAKQIVDAFLTTEEDHAARHDHRVEQIEAPIHS
ncbi:MAG: ribose 5-phosphate isomerase B [Armatimonadota bacterium]